VGIDQSYARFNRRPGAHSPWTATSAGSPELTLPRGVAHPTKYSLVSNLYGRAAAFFKWYFIKFSIISYRIDEGVRPMGHSKTLRAHARVLARLLKDMFGTGAASKSIPTSLLGAPVAAGVIEGHYDGDGAMQRKSAHARAYSATKRLLKDLHQALARCDVQSSISRMSERVLEGN
jgi:hypothetical protein